MRFLGWSVFVIVILATVLVVLLSPARPIPDGTVSRVLYAPGPYGVQLELFSVEDKTRKTSPNGKYKGADSRHLSGKLWRPYAGGETDQEPGPYPLIVYSHGFMSFHQEGAYVAEFMASHGYVVVAVDYPLTNYFAPGGPNLSDVINQPGDVKFIVDQVFERSEKVDDSLYQQIDKNRLGVVGLSLGGMTTELVTFDPRMKDDRIKAAVSIAGPSRMFTQKFFSFVDMPFMMIAGDVDAIVPYAENAAPLRQKDPDSVLVSLKGASHAGFAGISAILFRWSNNPDRFGCSSMKGKVERNDTQFGNLIDENYGVIKSERSGYCKNYKNLPKAMRPSQQHMLTTLAVYSFFESLFNKDITKRIKFATYLQKTYASENADVTVDSGDYRVAYKQ